MKSTSRASSPRVSISAVQGRRRRRRFRAAIRGGVILAVAGALALVGALMYTAAGDPIVVPPGDPEAMGPVDPPVENPICRPLAQAGPPRPWEAGIPVATYCTANALNRNLFTAIPLFHWSGVGPDMVMNLYHNSARIGPHIAPTPPMLANIGPGWSMSFSTRVVKVGYLNLDRLVIHDDGTQDLFTSNGAGGWDPPPGVHDRLMTFGFGLRLVHKDQSYQHFRGNKLREVGDGLGHEITITYGNTEPDFHYPVVNSITDASGRRLEFVHVETPAGPYIHTITAPATGSGDTFVEDRVWTFAYDGQQRVNKITDPMYYFIDIAYDAGGHITAMSDKRADAETPHTYAFTYLGHEVDVMTDPDQDQHSFVTDCSQLETVQITYVDRRGAGEEWLYQAARGPWLTKALQWTQNPLAQRDTFVFDADYNLETYTDALNHSWAYTYDGNGNMLSVTDPLNHDQQWTYDSLNNLLLYSNADGNTTQYRYEVPGQPTLLSGVIEPPDGQGNPAASTTIDYYLTGLGDPAASHGQVKQVTDPNGVVTMFAYDGWGQIAEYGEGDPSGQRLNAVYLESYTVDAAGQTRSVGSPSSSGTNAYNLDGWPTGSLECVAIPCCARSAPESFPALPDSPWLPSMYASFSVPAGGYTGLGQLIQSDVTLFANGEAVALREFVNQYDALARLYSASIDSNAEWPNQGPRGFTYMHELGSGTYTRVGPDGHMTVVQYDVANRVQSVVRGPEGAPLITADYTYYANGLVESVTYAAQTAAETSVVYWYDDANRVIRINHLNGLGVSLFRLTYWYVGTNGPAPTRIDDYELDARVASTYFEYDDRGRLIEENRTVSSSDYHLRYDYDQGGNRTKKTDLLNDTEVRYDYDINDVPTHDTANNRLMKYALYDSPGPNETLVSTTYYYYNDSGNPWRIVSETEDPEPGQPRFSATFLKYAVNGQTVSYAVGETWNNGGSGITEYTRTYAREFRYDRGRQRYLDAPLNTVTLESGDSARYWSDYDGNQNYGDFRIFAGQADYLRAFQPGMAHVSAPMSADPDVAYYHTDQIGTTRHLTDEAGAVIEPAVYTAFGERVSGTAQRYGYAGAWGYQSYRMDESPDVTLPFLHVGARYYDPASGRFLQRDPIGIAGGPNAYEYVRSAPQGHADPSGLWPSPPQEVNPWFPKPMPNWPPPPTPTPPKPGSLWDSIETLINIIASCFSYWFPAPFIPDVDPSRRLYASALEIMESLHWLPGRDEQLNHYDSAGQHQDTLAAGSYRILAYLRIGEERVGASPHGPPPEAS